MVTWTDGYITITTNTITTSFKITWLANNTKYNVTVAATNNCGAGSTDDLVSVSVNSTDAPTNATVYFGPTVVTPPTSTASQDDCLGNSSTVIGLQQCMS